MIRKQPIDLTITPSNSPFAKKVDVQKIISEEDGSSHFTTKRLIINPGGRIDLHTDSSDKQILVFTGKGAIYNEAEERIVAIDSDVFFIKKNTPYKIKNEGKTPLVLFVTRAVQND